MVDRQMMLISMTWEFGMYGRSDPTGPRNGAGESVAPYSVACSIRGGDRATLLCLASALHRRGVDVLTAELSGPVAERRTFEATILATPRQAGTVAATLGNLVLVTDVSVERAGALAGAGRPAG